MTAVWTFPWSVAAQGWDRAFAELADHAVDEVTVASHYHSIQTVQPRGEGSPFARYPGGAYFRPDPDRFADTPISPPVNEVGDTADPLRTAVEVAGEHGVGVNAWTVCLHNTRLGATYPEYRIRSAFGDPHDHSFCPSHPEVRSYFAGVVGSLADYDVGRIDLESLGFPSALHGHGDEFGHTKQQVVTTPSEEFLLSQCFCDACRAAAPDHLDVEGARELVRRLCRRTLETPGTAVPPLEDLVERHPELTDLVAFRTTVVERLLAALAEAADGVPLNYYTTDGFDHDPGTGWPAGVDLARVEPHLDRMTAFCYVADPETARRRIRELQAMVDVPVDAAVTMDPDVVPDRAAWNELAGVVAAVLSGDVNVYNHGLMTEEHLDWLHATTVGLAD